MEIKEPTPHDAFLQMRILRNEGHSCFEVIAIGDNNGFIQRFYNILNDQPCRYSRTGKVIEVSYE